VTFGAENTIRALLLLTGSAAVMLLTLPRLGSAREVNWRRIPGPTLVIVAVTILCVISVRPIADELYLWGRHSHVRSRHTNVIELVHGENFTVAVNRAHGKSLQLHINGKVVASTATPDMRLQRMLGHLPAMVNPEAKSALIIGLGAGVTSGSFVPYPGIERIVICEIEPAVAEVTGRHLAHANHNVLEDSRVEVIFDDGRHYLETTHEKFDIITTDPIHPWMKGSSALFTQEFFERAKEHLNPGGVIAQWVPLYESNLGAVQIQLKTMASVFEHTTLWNNQKKGHGYDLVLLGRSSPSTLSEEAYAKYTEDSEQLSGSLRSARLFPFQRLQSTYVGRIDATDDFYKPVPLNLDARMILEYEAGKAINYQRASEIFVRLAEHVTP
jgi:spermidine synthase